MTVTAPPPTGGPEDAPGRAWTCFAIGPLGDALAELGTPAREIHESALYVYENITQAACLPFGITPFRADELPGTGEILDQVCQQVKDADLVIADLSGLNHNVVFELALRQGTGKTTIQLSDGGDLPYHLSKVRTIRFRRTPHGMVQAREELRRTLEAGLRDGFDILTPARILNGVVVAKHDDLLGVPDDEDRLGLFEAMVRIEEDFEAIPEDIAEIKAAFEAFGAVNEAFGADFTRIGDAGSPKAGRAVAVRYAAAVSGPANSLDDAAARFLERMRSLDTGLRGVLEFMASTPQTQWPDEAESFLREIASLAGTYEEQPSEIREFSSFLNWAGNSSSAIRKPFRRMSDAIGRVEKAFSFFQNWAGIAQSLLEGQNLK
ncbi:hypothetical protein [Actinocorallia sp. A-T 12471]|uniref:hypothetical protein n=1 Tax=Actinocorallia sp. A-T 12471 TaxID=3089813 RepID=UPI0029CEF004|nr:hypothetical protein [Actinocorallia sp. A-T 12471]MDX6742580.1 hypothetical protein [Actinocorallia sp. A-T 12471]